LIIAVEIPVADSFFERVRDIVELGKLDHAAHFDPRSEPQTHGRYYAEESVTTDRQTEQLRIARAVAADNLAIGVHQLERLDIVDDRLQVQAATVHIRSERTAE